MRGLRAEAALRSFKRKEDREKQEQRQKEKHKTPVAMKAARKETRINIEAQQRQRYDTNSILDHRQRNHQYNEYNNLPRGSEVQMRRQQAGDQQR